MRIVFANRRIMKVKILKYQHYIKGFTRLESALLGLLFVSLGLIVWAVVPHKREEPANSDSQENYSDEESLRGNGMFFDMLGAGADEGSEDADTIPSLKGKTNMPSPRKAGSNNPAQKPPQKKSAAGSVSRKPPANKPKSASKKPAASRKPAGAASKKHAKRSVRVPGIKAEIINAPPEVMEILMELEEAVWGRETEKKLLGAVRRWAREDIEGAADFVLEIERRGTRNAAVNNILSTWMGSSPRKAMEWFNQSANQDEYLVSDMTSSFYSRLAQKQPVLAMEGIWDLPSAGLKTRALHSVSQRLMNFGHEEDVLKLYDAVETDEDRRIVIDVTMQKMARYEPYDLGEWAMGLQDPKDRKRAVNSFVAAWSRDHPSAAAEWVAAECPPEEDRARQISTVVGAWVKEDPLETADWLLSLFPESRETDPGVVRFARAVLPQDPGYAAAWSFSVTDNKERWRLMEQIAVNWKRKSPDAARDYIRRTDLPEGKKAWLLK